MSAYAGSVAPVYSPHVSLDRIPLVLVIGALVVGLMHRRLDARRSAAATFISLGMAIGLLAVHLVQLLSIDAANAVLQDVTTNLVRIGSYDVNFGFAFDRVSALFLSAALGGITLVCARNEFVRKNPLKTNELVSALLLATGVSLVVLADGFIGQLVGVSVVSVASYLFLVRSPLSFGAAGRIWGLQFVGIASLVAAHVLLFWALGGRWSSPDGYFPEIRPRFVDVHHRDRIAGPEQVVAPNNVIRGERDASAIAQRAKQRGTLTFTSHPGATVFVDSGDDVLDRATPFGVSPFVRKDLAAGPHEVIIVPAGGALVAGDGYEVAWIERLVVGADENVSIVALGPSTSFVEIANQFELVDAEGKHFLRNDLFNGKLGGSFEVVAIVVFFLAFAGLFWSLPLLVVSTMVKTSTSPLWNAIRLTALVVGIYPLVRLDELTAYHLGIVGVVFAVGIATVALVRMRRPALLLGAATMLAALLQVDASHAESRITVRPDQGSTVELGYAPDGETMQGTFVIRNDGTEPIQVSRLAIRGGEEDSRTPPFVTVDVQGVKVNGIELEAGKELRAVVRWKYGAARARELFGHVFVESTAREGSKVLPFHAQRPRDLGLFGDYALSHVIWLPLGAALLALVLRLVRRDNPRWLAWSSGFVYAANLLFVLFVAWRFDGRFGRVDGHDGYQFIERQVMSSSFPAEYFLGIDGLSLTFVIVISILALLAAVASHSLRQSALTFHVAASVLVTSVMGILLSLDLLMFCVFWIFATVSIGVLVGDRSDKSTQLRVGAYLAAGVVILGAVAYWLHQHSDPTYDVAGRYWPHTLAIVDLARVQWVNVQSRLFGILGLEVIWSALFLVFVQRLVVMPAVHAASDTPTNILVPGVWIGTGVYGLLRFNVGVLPAGAKWAALTIEVVGVAFLIVFALLAAMETDLKRFVARISTAYAGFALVGLGSRTPQGFMAAVHVAIALALGVGLSLALVDALEQRVRIRDATKFAGLSTDMPVFAAVLGMAILSSMGLPGLLGFWGVLLSIVGAFVRYPAIALFALLMAVVVAAIQIRLAGKILFGAVPTSWRKNKYLEPFAGRFPDLYPHELLVTVPVVLLMIGWGLAPRTLFSMLDVVLLDLHRLVDAMGAGQVG